MGLNDTAQLGVEIKPSGINETTVMLQILANQAHNTEIAVKNLTDATLNQSSAHRQFSTSSNEAGMSIGQLGLRIAGYATGLQLAIAVTRDVIRGIEDLAKQAVSAAADFERYRMQWGVLVGDMKEGAKVFQELYDFSVRTPLTFEAVGPAAQMLRAFGVEVKDLIPTLEMLGNLALGDNNRLQLIAKSYGEMFASAHVQARNLIQMVRDGVPIYDALAESMHKSVGEISQMTREGKLGFDEVRKAVELLNSEGHIFHNEMEIMAESFSGKWAIAVDKWRAVLASTANDVLPGLKSGLDTINGLMDKILLKSSAQTYIQTGQGDPKALLKSLQYYSEKETEKYGNLWDINSMMFNPYDALKTQVILAQSLWQSSDAGMRLRQTEKANKSASTTKLDEYQTWFQEETGMSMPGLSIPEAAQILVGGYTRNIAEFDKLGIDQREKYAKAINNLIEKMIESGLWVANDASIKILSGYAQKLSQNITPNITPSGYYEGTTAVEEALKLLFPTPANALGIGVHGYAFPQGIHSLFGQVGITPQDIVNEYEKQIQEVFGYPYYEEGTNSIQEMLQQLFPPRIGTGMDGGLLFKAKLPTPEKVAQTIIDDYDKQIQDIFGHPYYEGTTFVEDILKQLFPSQIGVGLEGGLSFKVKLPTPEEVAQAVIDEYEKQIQEVFGHPYYEEGTNSVQEMLQQLFPPKVGVGLEGGLSFKIKLPTPEEVAQALVDEYEKQIQEIFGYPYYEEGTNSVQENLKQLFPANISHGIAGGILFKTQLPPSLEEQVAAQEAQFTAIRAQEQYEMPIYASNEEYEEVRAWRDKMAMQAMQDYWSRKYPMAAGVALSNWQGTELEQTLAMMEANRRALELPAPYAEGNIKPWQMAQQNMGAINPVTGDIRGYYFDETMQSPFPPIPPSVSERIKTLNEQFDEGKISIAEYVAKFAELNKESVKLSDTISGLYQAIEQAALGELAKGVTNEFKTLGEVLAGNKDAADTLGDSMKRMILEMANVLPQMLLEAGLRLVFTAAWPTGIALIAASGLVAIGAGAANYSASQEVQTTTVPSAKGNVFNSPSLSMYENGIYNTPHYFGFANGGVFGEAGYEAIMPLARSASGYLGVRANVAPVNVQVINNVGANVSTKETVDENGVRQLQILIDKAVGSAIARGKADKALKSRYGTSVVGAQRM